MRPATRSGCGWEWAVTEVSGEERLARAALTCVAEPGDPVMGALLRTCSPAEIVTALVRGRVPVPAAGTARPGRDRPRGPDWDPQGPDWDGLPGWTWPDCQGWSGTACRGWTGRCAGGPPGWARHRRSPIWT